MASYLLQCIRENGCDDVLLFLNPDLYATETTEHSPELPEDEFLTDGYPSEMALVPPRNGCSRICPGKGELLPPFASSENGNLYLFCPLHFREREIGYLAFKNCDYILKNQFLFETLTTKRAGIPVRKTDPAQNECGTVAALHPRLSDRALQPHGL